MINPTDYSFDVGIYTGLTLQGVTDLVYEKLNILDPTGYDPLWTEYNDITREHFFAQAGVVGQVYDSEALWRQSASIRKRQIQKALEIIELVDGPKSANPIQKEIITEVEPSSIDSIETIPLDDGLLEISEIQVVNYELEKDTNIGSPILETNVEPEDVIEQPGDDSSEDVKSQSESDFIPVQLTEVSKPSIRPIPITFNTGNMSPKDQKQFEVGLGQVPLVYYNGIHIEYNRIKTFMLYHEGILPALKVSFADQASFRDIGFPTDDISITVYINSRSKLVRSIYMDFKVTNMRDSEGIISITGITDIPQIYIAKFESYNSRTSLDVMKEIAKTCKLGFQSNISSTSDKQTWINPGFKRKAWIESICENAYISDKSFVTCYIDFYYNLCYMDLEKEIGRDISKDQMRLSTGKSEITDDPRDEDTIIPVLLTTDKSALDTNCHVNKVDILNRSTRISLNRAYSTKTKFYDDINKEILIFDIDTIAEDKTKLILKAKLNDSQFYKENQNNVWVGKIDKYGNGDGNSHDNYNYSQIHNKVNRTELNKIDIDIELDIPNYNFYLFQKIRFELIYDVPGALSTSMKHERISGEAIINSLEFVFDGNRFYQKIGLLRRDLEKTEEEIENTSDDKNYKEEYQENDNPLGPDDNLSQVEDLEVPELEVISPKIVELDVPNTIQDTTTFIVNERVIKAMDLLINEHGSSRYGASAIVGNMLAESNLIVDTLEISLLNQKKSWNGGVSLVQWTGVRRTSFEKYFGIANSRTERKKLIGISNENVEDYQKKVREKVSFEAAIKYYWEELSSSVRSKLETADDSEKAADAILADLRPGDYLCWSLWDGKGATSEFCTRGQKTKADALIWKNKQRNHRVENSQIAYNTYSQNRLA